MSARAGIVAYLETTLAGAGFAFVTRRRLRAAEIADAQFPASVIEGGPENCRQISLNANKVEADWTVDIHVHTYTRGGDSQAAWENQAAAAVRALTADHTFGNLAVLTELVAKIPDPRVFAPWASGLVRLRIIYRFNELTQGG